MKKVIIIISVVLVVAAALVFLIPPSSEDEGVNNNQQPDKFSDNYESIDSSNGTVTDQNYNSGCSNDQVIFTEAFVDNDKIRSIGPIGALDGGSHGRSYVQITEGGQTPVYMPTDAILEYIVYARRDPSSDIGEYGLWFRTGCDLIFLFDHLDNLSEELLALAPTEFSESSATGGPIVGYQATAGELIAFTDGTDQARTFDFLVIDQSKPVEYINPDRFLWDQNLYAQCPYQYFTEELKNEYFSLLVEPNNINNDCGSPSFDVAGTAAGAWFQGDDKDMRGRWMTFGTYTSFSGLAIRKDAGVDFSVRDYSPIIKPEDMKPGDQVCYGYNGNWAYARLENADQLSVATGSGSCPSSFPENQAENWIR